MTVAVSRAKGRGAEAVICASTGNTAASCAAYAARAGLRGAVIVPEGKIAIGKLAQALMHGARVVALQGNFDDALTLVREIAQKHPVELVNSVNPHRVEGQKTGAFEIVEELGGMPGALAIPVGNGGNVTAYWRGFTELAEQPCRGSRGWAGRRSSTASRPRARRRWSTAPRSPARRPSPRRSGSATRPAGRRRWRPSPARAAASPPSPTSRSSTPTAGWPPTKASSASPPRPPRSPACSPTACRWWRATAPPETVVCVLTGHGLKDPDTALGKAPAVIACENDLGRGRARRLPVDSSVLPNKQFGNTELSSRIAEPSMRPVNPFVFSRPVDAADMIDRDEESEQLLALAEGGHAVRLSAPRRYGKTSLLRRLGSRGRKGGDALRRGRFLRRPLPARRRGPPRGRVFQPSLDRQERRHRSDPTLRPAVSVGGGPVRVESRPRADEGTVAPADEAARPARLQLFERTGNQDACRLRRVPGSPGGGHRHRRPLPQSHPAPR